MEDNKIYDTILKLCGQYSSGLTNEILRKELEGIETKKIVDNINKLLKEGRITTFKDQNSRVVYKEKSVEEITKFKGLSKEEMLIYQIIEQSGNMGIWTRNLKTQSNLQQVQITKILKKLEARKLIKSVNSVTNKNRKVYMLYNLEPHVDISGDIWYSGQEIDSEFIDILNKQCFNFINQKGYATAEELCAFIRKSGISKVELKLSNVQSILDNLIYDGKIEAIEDPRGFSFIGGKNTIYYKPTKLEIIENGFTQTPCGICPVFNQCSDEGEITPIKCIYFKNWLKW